MKGADVDILALFLYKGFWGCDIGIISEIRALAKAVNRRGSSKSPW
jgi:hypothetical protein